MLTAQRSVAETLALVAKGELHDLHRDELFGLTHDKFVEEHKLPFQLVESARDYITTAAQYRNTNHPHVKKLKLDPVMGRYGQRLMEIHDSIAEDALSLFKRTVHNTKIATAADDDGVQISDISKQSFLAGLKAVFQRRKTDFKQAAEQAHREAQQAGRDAAYAKLSVYLGDDDIPDDEDDDDSIREFSDDDSMYFDGVGDDIELNSGRVLEEKHGTMDSLINALTGGLYSQAYRNDLFVSNLYRSAQYAQRSYMDDTKDPAGQEWKYKWVTILDEKTCEVCRELHDKVMYLNEFEYDPGDVHGYCRCDLDPVPPGEEPDESETVEGPNNEGTPPDGPLPESGPTDEWIPLEEEDEFYSRVEPRENWQSRLAQLNPQSVDTYLRNTDLRDKLLHVDSDYLIAKRWQNPADLVTEHFQYAHGTKPDGLYKDQAWWNRMTSLKAKEEMGVLVRFDELYGKFKEGTGLDYVGVVTKAPLVIQRVVTTAQNEDYIRKTAAWYERASNTITIHDNTFKSMANATSTEWNHLVSHEVGHATTMNLMKSPSTRNAYVAMEERWARILNRADVENRLDGFASKYGRDAWLGKTGIPGMLPGNVDEDIAESMADFMTNPEAMLKNEFGAKKHALLSEHVFRGQVSSGIPQQQKLL